MDTRTTGSTYPYARDACAIIQLCGSQHVSLEWLTL
jgi:hypothetical protein